MTTNDDWNAIAHEFQGSYTRKQGKKRQYEYYVTLFTVRDGYRWTAEMWSEEEFKGTLSGKEPSTSLEDGETAVRNRVCECIENLIAMTE